MKKAILFDFDGTLANTIPGIMDTTEATRKKMQADFSLEEAHALIGKPLTEMGQHLVGEDRAEEFVTTYLSLFPEIAGKAVAFFPGIPELLEELRKRELLIAIVSSKRLSSLNTNLEVLHAHHYFDLLVANDATAFHKPHPAPVEYALDQLGVEPKEALMIGDTAFDLLSGEGAGVATIGVTWGICTKEQLNAYQPTAFAENIRELAAEITKLL